MDRTKHGVQLIQAEQDKGTTADRQLTELDRAVSRLTDCSSLLFALYGEKTPLHDLIIAESSAGFI